MKSLVCRFFGHRYITYAEPEDLECGGAYWLKCTRCGKNFIADIHSETIEHKSHSEIAMMYDWMVFNGRRGKEK